jgi:oxalate decarboxylase/phosphoglucose isomerase-like protein (cupin superfamily)
MNIKSARSRESLSEVLMDPKSRGPEIAYWVLENISTGSDEWRNLTILAPGKYGQEYTKTYGHYHTSEQEVEISKLIKGKGLFLLQKKFYDTRGNWITHQVDVAYLIEATPEDDPVYIPKNYAHSWVNTGTLPLMTYDNWRETGEPTHTYDEVKDLHGLAYYIIEGKNGNPQAVPNPNYRDLAEPKWVTPEEFNYLSQNN